MREQDKRHEKKGKITKIRKINAREGVECVGEKEEGVGE